MANEEYKKYADLVEYKYRGKKTINRWNVSALKKASDSLKKLNQAIETCYRKNEEGAYEPIGAERLKTLKACYKECLENVNIARQKNSRADILNTVYEVLRSDSRTVYALQEDAAFPEYFRRDVVSFEEMPVEPVGGALSARIPVEYVDGDGKQKKGFFTKESFFENRDYMQVFAEIVKKEDETNKYGPLLSNLIESKTFMDKMKKSASTSEFVRKIYERILQHDLPLNEEIEACNKLFSEYGITKRLTVPESQEIDPSIGRPGWIICNFVDHYFTSNGLKEIKKTEETRNALYKKDIEINAGDNITDRNCAMTEIAKLLGRDDLLAQSVPMEICYQGTKQRGIFMETVDGYEISNVMRNSQKLHLDRMTSSAIKDIADIQIIDYICGNIDRHSGNLIYQFDNEGNLEHVKGIDHDLSMGTIKADCWSGRQWLPEVENMYVISETMAQRIQNMKEEDMQLMLSALDLPKEQKAQAWERVKDMKARIAKASRLTENEVLDHPISSQRLRIVPEDAWDNVKLDALVIKVDDLALLDDKDRRDEIQYDMEEASHHNIFSNLCLKQQLAERAHQKNLAGAENNNPRPEQQYNQGDIVSVAFAQAALRNDAKDVGELLQTLEETIGSKGLEGRGMEFRQMHSEVKKLKEWYDQNAQKKEWTLTEKNKLSELYQEAAEKCQTYINTHDPYSSMGKKRQQVATDLLEFLGTRGMAIDPFCQQKQMIPVEERNILLDREKALNGLEELKQKNTLADEEKKKAVQLMSHVVKTDLENGISKQTLMEKLPFGPDKKEKSLEPEDIRNFVSAEAQEFGNEMHRQAEAQEKELAEQKEKTQRCQTKNIKNTKIL